VTRPSRHSGESGLTATELVVASMFLLVLTGLIWITFRTDTQSYIRQTSASNVQNPLRIWIARMEKDIRRACFNPADTSPNSFALVSATPTDFRFNLDEGTTTGTLDTADAHSNIGYRLNGTDLELWQSGSTWRPVLPNVTALTFTYYDSQGYQRNSTSPYTTMQGISAVEVTISARQTTGGIAGTSAPVVTEHFKAALRNACS